MYTNLPSNNRGQTNQLFLIINIVYFLWKKICHVFLKIFFDISFVSENKEMLLLIMFIHINYLFNILTIKYIYETLNGIGRFTVASTEIH